MLIHRTGERGPRRRCTVCHVEIVYGTKVCPVCLRTPKPKRKKT